MSGLLRRTICLTLVFLLIFNPILAAAGGIVADPKAPAGKQPGLNAAPNGVPMVNIARPNGKGLSHNMFDQFNVGTPGVIMNNSNKPGRTQLGGVVVNNPNLGGGAEARTILNEVTGGSRSQLEGYTEIFGYPADYILSNPNGITINGGGFINTPKATLATGKPRLDENGGLVFDVRKGDVLVDGQGLNVANLDAFDIICRTAKINAAIHAKNLGITTGYGSLDPVTGLFSALPADGSSAPVVALDSTALGGMYAERIILVGNEKGVGVNLEGITRATDELVLTADGKIRIKGAVSSDKRVSVASAHDSVEIAGSLAAGLLADVKAAKDLKLQSDAGGESVLYGADVHITSGSLHNANGRIEADNSLTVTSADDVINAGVIRAGSSAVLKAGGAVRNSGQVQAENILTVDSHAVVENSGLLLSIGAVKIHSSGGIANSGGEILAKDAMTLASAGNIANTGAIRAEGQASINAGSLSNTGGSILSKDMMTLESAGDIVNTGTIGTDQKANISAGNVLNTGGGILAQGDLDIQVAGSLSNSGTVYSGAFSHIRTGGDMLNDSAGQVLALNSLSLEAGVDLENMGIISAGEAVSMRTGGSLCNTGGSILAQTGLALTSLGNIKNSGSIQSGGPGSYQSGGILLNAGDIVSKGDLDLSLAGDLSNSGTIASDGDADFTIGGSLRNTTDGRMQAAGAAVFDVTGDLSNSGRMQFSGMGSFSVRGGLFNTGGDILSQTALDFNVLGAMDNAGTLHSGDLLSLRSDRLDNSGQMLAVGMSVFDVTGDLRNSGRMEFTGSGSFSVGGELFNTGGDILSQTALDFNVLGAMDNTGTLHSGDLLSLCSDSLGNSGRILTGGTSLFDVTGDLRNSGRMEFVGEGSFRVGRGLSNTGGDILSKTALDFEVLGAMDNTGTLYSGDRLSLHSDSLDNSGQMLAAGAAVFDVNGDLRNSGRMQFTGPGSFSVGSGLFNTDGDILSQTALDFDVQGALENTGTLHSGDLLSLRSNSLDNSGQILAQGDSAVAVQGDLINTNFLFSGGESSFSVGGVLQNIRGQILSLGDMVLEGLSAGSRMLELKNDSGTIETLEGSMSIRAKVVRNTNLDFVLTPGTEVVSRKGGYSPGRMIWYGYIRGFSDESDGTPGIVELMRKPYSTIMSGEELRILGFDTESNWLSRSELEAAIAAAEIIFDLYGGSSEDIATVSNLKCRLLHSELYATLPRASKVAANPDAMIISSAELLTLGFGLDRTVIMRSELDAAIAAAEARFAVSGGDPDEIAAVSSFKKRMVERGTCLAIQHNTYNSKTEAAYIESIIKDDVTGMESSANIAAAVDLDIEAESFRNSVSRISTALGDITIDTGAFENVGHDINEYHTVQWSLGRASYFLPFPYNVSFEGKGFEVVKIPTDYAYGTISGGGKVFISADHVTNGISENMGVASSENGKISFNGGIEPQGGIGLQEDIGPQDDIEPQDMIIAPPRPGAQVLGVGNIVDLIGSLPKDGLFSVNNTPGHRYLIESNPALTSMALFYGSDYFLGQTGIDLSRTHQQLLGDAFYESRLVREQVFALTGRRYLSASVASDGEQMLALMDNALAAQKNLNLSVGVALTAEQIAVLSSDIVWLETRVVDGHEVLVPVVYLCRASLDTIAQGGSVIIGRNVEIRTTGDTVNRGVIKAAGDLAINANNVFNTFGTIQGDTVTLAAVDSIFNTSGLIKGRDVSLDAGQDIISRTAKTTFSTEGKFTRSSSETVGQRGFIEASEDLTMRAGRDIEFIGSDVKAGGDATLDAGRNVVIAAQNLESHNSMKTRRSKGNYNTQTSKAATVEAVGSVNISAGQDVAVYGSHVSAGTDVNIEAGRDVSITAATEGFDYYYKKKSKGGLFGGSSSKMRASKVTTNAASAIKAGGDVNILAGKGGAGDLAVVGSKVRSGEDMNLKAAGDVLVVMAQESASHSSKSSKSGFFSKESSSGQKQEVAVVKSELSSGEDMRIESGTTGDGDILIHSSKLTSDGDVELKSAGDVLITADRDQSYSHYESQDSGFASLTPSMEMVDHQRTTTVGSEIAADGKIALEAKDNVAIQAATIKSDESVSITATEGQVALLTGTDTSYDQKVTQKTGLLTWKSSDKGKSAEIVVPTIIQTDLGLSIRAGNGVVVEYRQTGNVRRDVELLAQNPGLEWMGPLLERKDINWQAVQDNFTKWNKTDSGLAPAATLFIAIAAAAATAGTASSLALSVMGLEVSTLTGAVVVAGTQTAATSVQLAMVSALTAGITSIGSRLAVSVADAAAGGDLGKNLESMVSEDSARSLLTTMVSAGVLSTTASTFASYGPAGEIMANTAVKTVTSNLVGGEDLEKAFLTSLASSFASYAKSEISAEELDDAVNIVIAGAAGAASAAALGQDPMQGAMSAIVAELANTYLAPALSEEQKKRDGPMVRLAKCNYDNCMETDGYKLLSDEKLFEAKINPADMRDKESGYSAKVYHNEDLNEYVIVFTGTDETKDWSTNFAQAFGLVGNQYKQAGDLNILEKLSNLADSTGGTLAATGHSLGGGLATAVASTGLIDRAVVFNTAGVHEKTIAAIGGRIENARAVTTAYASRADILNNLQDIIPKMPSALGTRVVLEAGGLHGIEGLVKVFGPN